MRRRPLFPLPLVLPPTNTGFREGKDAAVARPDEADPAPLAHDAAPHRRPGIEGPQHLAVQRGEANHVAGLADGLRVLGLKGVLADPPQERLDVHAHSSAIPRRRRAYPSCACGHTARRVCCVLIMWLCWGAEVVAVAKVARRRHMMDCGFV